MMVLFKISTQLPVGFHLRECKFSRSDDILSLRFVMFTDALNILASPVYLLVDQQGDLKKTCWNAELVFGWDVKRSYSIIEYTWTVLCICIGIYLSIYLSLCMCTCIYFDTSAVFFCLRQRLLWGNFLPVVQCGVHESMGYLENHACGAWGSLICVPTKFPNLTPKEDIQKVCLNPSVSKKKSVWTLHHACRAWENVLCPAILCDLFGIVKWPSTGDQLVKLNHLVIFVPTIFPNPSQTRHPKICFEHSLPIAVSRPCFFQILKIIYYQ